MNIKLFIACLVGIVSFASAAPRPVLVQPDSQLWLVGDSTLHAFTSRTTSLDVAAEAETPATISLGESLLAADNLRTFTLSVPVQSLKSKDAALDKNMYKALKADVHPTITFTLDRFDRRISTGTLPGVPVTVKGRLTIAGVEKSIEMDLQAIPGLADLHVQGRYALRMSDYGIKPPTMMMGAVRVKDLVMIHFDLHLISPTP